MREAQSGREGLQVEGPAGTKAAGQDRAWLEPVRDVGRPPGHVGPAAWKSLLFLLRAVTGSAGAGEDGRAWGAARSECHDHPGGPWVS